MVRKPLAALLLSVSLMQSAWADAPADLAGRVQVYLYRPEVFADRYLGIGIPANRAPLGGRLWYIRLNRSVHALAPPETLGRFIRDYAIPGLDFTDDRTISVGEMERILQPVAGAMRLLKMSGSMLTDQILPTVGNFLDLQTLELSEQVTDRGIPFLKNLRGLRFLAIPAPGVTDQSVPTFARYSRLERLNLKGSHITDAGIQGLSALPLRELDLGNFSTDRSLTAIGAIATLEQLDLSQAQVTAAGLSALSKAPRIHTLFLGPSITDADMAVLPAFKSLKRLDLAGARITDQSADVLARMSQLEELALTRTQITRAAIEKIARLPHLRYLEISQTQIHPEDFSRLPPFPALQVISFSSSRRLTLQEARDLSAWPRLHSILINGVLLGPDLVDYLRGSRRSENWPVWVPDAEAAAISDAEVDHALDVASKPLVDKGAAHPFAGFDGLKRIHEAESSLEDVSAAPSNPTADTFQENEKNFLGEFTVNAVPEKKKS